MTFLGINYGMQHSFVHLICCLEHPAVATCCIYNYTLYIAMTVSGILTPILANFCASVKNLGKPMQWHIQGWA